MGAKGLVIHDKKQENTITHVCSLTALRHRNKRTISTLDPYTPRGLIMNLSNALKSTFVTLAWAPGQMTLMNFLRLSCAMMILSTTKTQV